MMECRAVRVPCATCPYRRDTPPGIWSRDEYEKLPAFDGIAFGIFMCHSTDGGELKMCRGWLSVHADSIAVRVLILQHRVEEAYAVPPVPLYGSGAEACAAGLRGIARPSRKARAAMSKILKGRSMRRLGGDNL